jgi:hypothetical protein
VGGPVFTGGVNGVAAAGAFGPFSAGWFGGATASCGVAGSFLVTGGAALRIRRHRRCIVNRRPRRACAGTAASLIDQFWRRSAQDQMKYVSCPVEYPPPSVAIWTWSK